MATLGIEGVQGYWKRAIALETPTNRSETHEYFLNSATQSGMLRAVLGQRATLFKIPDNRRGKVNQTNTRKYMRGARAHIATVSHTDTRVFSGFIDLLYDVRSDWQENERSSSSWQRKTVNLLRLLYHIKTTDGVQLFHSVCPVLMGPEAGSVMVSFYRRPELQELVEKISASPVAWIYWWSLEVLHLSNECLQLILKGCDMDEVYLISETDWDHETYTVSTPFEDAEDEFARTAEEDGLVFDMSALAPPSSPTKVNTAAPPTPTATTPANANTGTAGENNVNSKGYYMSEEQQAAVDAMGIRDDATFATRATDAASRVSGATANTSGANTFRSATTADNKRSFWEECLAKAKRKASDIAGAIHPNQTGSDQAESTNLQGKPASKGLATTSPSKTSEANSREAAMGSGAGG